MDAHMLAKAYSRYMKSQPGLRDLSWSKDRIVFQIYFNKGGLHSTLQRHHDFRSDKHTLKTKDIENLCTSFGTPSLRYEAVDVSERREAADNMIKRT